MTLKSLTRWLALIVAAGALLGCSHGRDFMKPPESVLVLGKSTRTEVIAQVGPPGTQNSQYRRLTASDALRAAGMVAEGQYTSLTYSWVNPSGQAAPGVSPQKSASFYFWNDVLVSYSYTSSFAADSTAFPEAAFGKIVRDKSTEKDVIALFGPPTGRGIYPFTARPDMRVMDYFHFEWNKGRGVYTSKRLVIMLDAAGVVRDYRYDNDVNPIPPPSSGGVPYFVTIPVRKK